jgi:hypothetical protein
MQLKSTQPLASWPNSWLSPVIAAANIKTVTFVNQFGRGLTIASSSVRYIGFSVLHVIFSILELVVNRVDTIMMMFLLFFCEVYSHSCIANELLLLTAEQCYFIRIASLCYEMMMKMCFNLVSFSYSIIFKLTS